MGVDYSNLKHQHTARRTYRNRHITIIITTTIIIVIIIIIIIIIIMLKIFYSAIQRENTSSRS